MRGPEWWFWQSRRTPPDGMTRAGLEALVRAAFPGADGDAMLALAQPTLRLWSQTLPAEALPTLSRLGGLPCAPARWRWPRYEGDPLLFLGQINCADLAGLAAAEALPARGLLAFFGHYGAVNGCGVDSPKQWAVHHWPEVASVAPVAAPVGYRGALPECALRFFQSWSLPFPGGYAAERFDVKGPRTPRWDAYWDLVAALRNDGAPERPADLIEVSKLLGWPDLVQNDFWVYGEGAKLDWRLLLQLGSYENGSTQHCWGPGGTLYFFTPASALKQPRSEQILLQVQVT
jgi:uncharacterized protein YwqG